MTLTFGLRLAVMLPGRFFWSVCRTVTLTDAFLAILLSRLLIQSFRCQWKCRVNEQVGFRRVMHDA